MDWANLLLEGCVVVGGDVRSCCFVFVFVS